MPSKPPKCAPCRVEQQPLRSTKTYWAKASRTSRSSTPASSPFANGFTSNGPTPVAISLKTGQPTYASRTNVTLDMSVQATATSSTQANLSVAVYRLDSLAAASSENILSNLWLTADLAGTIESPDYYLQPENDDVKRATDNLMLTHGWRRFRWTDVLQNKPASAGPFIPEVNGPIIQGTVTDPVSGEALPNKLTYLSTPGKPIRLYVSRSDACGANPVRDAGFLRVAAHHCTNESERQSGQTDDHQSLYRIHRPAFPACPYHAGIAGRPAPEPERSHAGTVHLQGRPYRAVS